MLHIGYMISLLSFSFSLGKISLYMHVATVTTMLLKHYSIEELPWMSLIRYLRLSIVRFSAHYWHFFML